jgi:phospholipid/cholesterol/gamma-HCH transport system substrate-binding protein
MITRAQKVRLGVFVAASLALLVVTLIVLAGVQVVSRKDAYTVRYTVSMSGLEPGAQVKYNGVRVGTVDALRINREDVSEVVVTLSLDRGTPVKTDTKAVVNLAGITGLKFIELTGGTSGTDFIEPGGEIPAGESLLDKLSGRAEAIAEKAELLLNQLGTATSPENRERVFKVVDHAGELIDTAKATLDENRENVRVAIENVRNATEHATAVLDRLDHEGTAALVAIRQAAEGLRDGIDRAQIAATVKNVEHLTATLRTAIDGADLPGILAAVKGVAGDARGVMKNVDLTVLRSRDTLAASLAYLQEGLENFSQFAQSIRENPSLLFNAPREHERNAQ